MQRDESFETGGRRPASPDGVSGGTAAAVETWEGEGGSAARTQPARSKNPVKKPGQHVRRKGGKAAACRAVMLATTLAAAVLGPGAPATAAPAEDRMSYAQAERRAIELRQGMTLDDVRKLLGKPKRTALKTAGYGGTAESSQGTLQWTYSWSSPSQSERTLQVTFLAKAPEQWLVNGWDWSSY